MGQTEKKKAVIGLVVVFLVAIFLSLTTASIVKSTSTVDFCASCDEMQIFYDTWEKSIHGKAKKGVIKAKCVDCHLPHNGIVTYLLDKAKFGIHDYTVHISKKELDWEAKWKTRKPDVQMAYESGCRKCHKNLIAPGIPLKAFKAHRKYELGETRKNCISCHKDAGHGDLLKAIRERKSV